MTNELKAHILTPLYKPVIIIGGGPAGLSLSYFLQKRGIEHLILEKGQVGESWRRQRWDSLRLTGPNWLFYLPGSPYSGDDPDGFMDKHDVVAFLEKYAQQIEAPLRCGIQVKSISAKPESNGFAIETTTNDYYEADHVIAATGIFQSPRVPTFSENLPSDIFQIAPTSYRRPDLLPAGAVLVVGSGESGSQIAEDLRHSGRSVYLSVGHSTWLPRFYRGKDFAWWFNEMGHFDEAIIQFRQGMTIKTEEGLQAVGSDSGHDVNLHTLVRDGVALLGRLEDIANGKLLFASDLHDRLVEADNKAMEAKAKIDAFIKTKQLDVLPDDWTHYADAYSALSDEPILELDINKAGIKTILWATGHQPDFSYVKLPVFDDMSRLIHDRWLTPFPGFYFFSLPLLIERCGIEAKYLASVIESRITDSATTTTGEPRTLKYKQNNARPL